jgi:hypothetical protein
MPQPNSRLPVFQRWAREARYGEVFVYHREPFARDSVLFEYARKLSDAGIAFLYQRRADNHQWEKACKRIGVQAALTLDKLSETVHVEASESFVVEKWELGDDLNAAERAIIDAYCKRERLARRVSRH